MIEVFNFFFFKQKTAYEIKECDWSSDVCSSDLAVSTTTRRSSFSNAPRTVFPPGKLLTTSEPITISTLIFSLATSRRMVLMDISSSFFITGRKPVASDGFLLSNQALARASMAPGSSPPNPVLRESVPSNGRER